MRSRTSISLSVLLLLIGGCNGSSSGSGSSNSVGTTTNVEGVSVQQIAPSGGSAESPHYKMTFTVGASVDNTAASSPNYRMQGGLTGADITTR